MRIFLLTILVFSSLFSLDRAMRLKMKAEPKVALVVGNSSYSKSNYFDKLKNPINDVKKVAKKLRALGFQVIEAHNISDLELQKRLKKFYSLLRSQKEGVGLFYFAGHGIEVNGINYLIPNDISVADESYVPYRSTPLNPIIESMNKTGKRLNIAVIDACRENPYTSTRNKKRGGLASFSASGTFIAYSAESGKLAHDGDGKLSPFAEAFVKNIETPQTIEQFFKAVRNDVYQKTDGEQTPMTHNLIRGDFYFKLPSESDLKRVQIQNDKPISKKNRIYVSTTPSDARVRILNISPKYYDGIDLKTDKALIEVTKSGYKKYLKWHRNLGDEVVISVELEKDYRVKPDNDSGSSSRVIPVPDTGISKKGEWDKRIFRGKRSYSKFSRNLVKDNYTNLVWTKNGSSKEMNWKSAKRYCRDLSVDGYSDFRLPTIEELYYLADRSKRNPAIDSNFFNLESSWYWSQTIIKSNNSKSWVVYFNSGYDFWDSQTDYNFAVCVRVLK
jgi:hypothetical protein